MRRCFAELGLCTFAFMWRGSDGETYMSTAGHCALGDELGEAAWAEGDGPLAGDGQGNVIGEFAYAVRRRTPRLRPDPPRRRRGRHPQMCHFGGPTGINADIAAPSRPRSSSSTAGPTVRSLIPGRTLVALGMPDRDHVFATGIALPGDSGSGVTTTDGRAVGVVVATGIHTGSIGLGWARRGHHRHHPPGTQIARAQQVTGVSYALQTAPLLSGGRPGLRRAGPERPDSGAGSTGPERPHGAGSAVDGHRTTRMLKSARPSTPMSLIHRGRYISMPARTGDVAQVEHVLPRPAEVAEEARARWPWRRRRCRT